MRILLIHKFHFPLGGAERAYFDTGKIFEGNGHEIAYFSTKDPRNVPCRWEKYFPEFYDYGATDGSIGKKLKATKSLFWNTDSQQKLQQLIQDFRPDVAHAHAIYHHLSASILATLKKASIPVVMTLHDYKLASPAYNLTVGNSIWEKHPLLCIPDKCVQDSYAKSSVSVLEHYFHKLKKSYAFVNQFIAPSKFIIKKHKELGFPYPIEHVPQPVVLPRKHSRSERMGGHLLFVGRLDPLKGADTIIEAMDGAQRNWVLHIVGSGKHEQMLRAMAEERGMAARVKFFGFLDGNKLWDQIFSAGIVIVPSIIRENMPYSMLEALRARRVVIATRNGGITERIHHGENGFLFERGDAAGLRSILDSLDSYDLDTIRNNAFFSTKDLTPDAYYTHLDSVYTRVMENQIS